MAVQPIEATPADLIRVPDSERAVSDREAVIVPLGARSVQFKVDISQLLPLTGLEMAIEVSEDGGATWRAVGYSTHDATCKSNTDLTLNLSEPNKNPAFRARAKRTVYSLTDKKVAGQRDSVGTLLTPLVAALYVE